MNKSYSWLKKPLDIVLKEKGRVKAEQLEEIRKVRAVEGGGWVAHFVDTGCMTENELINILLADTGLPYISLLNITTPQALLNDYTRDFLIAFECYPIDSIGPVCTLATCNPYQKDLLMARRNELQTIQLFLCRLSEWRECIHRLQEEGSLTV